MHLKSQVFIFFSKYCQCENHIDKLQKTKEKIFSLGKVPNNQETRKKNRQYSKEKQK